MSKLPELSVRDVLKVLAFFGYQPDHQTGSHLICRNSQTRRMVVVPAHNPIAKGTLRAIIREAGLTRDEFLDQLD
jgi:predicted RNA binding protein YcfA (HicA-like mRNA interferase family)